MARFRGTVQGSREEASRLGTVGLETQCNGWARGVRVSAHKYQDQDTFSIHLDGGSGHAGMAWRLAEVGGDGTIRIFNSKGETVMVLMDLVEE